MNKQIFKQIYSDYVAMGLGIFSLFSLLFLGYWFIDIERLIVTFNLGYAIVHIVLHILLSILFSGLVIVRTYKIKKQQIQNEKKSGFLGMIGGIVGVIITGCPVCGGWTLISLFGLTNFLAYLPRYGLEVKLLSVFLLFWSLDIVFGNIDRCQIFRFVLRLKRKIILGSMLVLLLSILGIRYIMSPDNIVKLPGNVILSPNAEYIIFPYELQEGCSNNLFFVEFLPKVEKNTKIIGIYSYNVETLKNFNTCKYEGLDSEVDINYFEKIVKDYDTSFGIIKVLNNTKYLVKYYECKDYELPSCLEGNYRFIKNKVAHKIVVKLASGNIVSKDTSIGLLDEEIDKQQIE